MPTETLYLLASIPLVFAVYDALCFFFVKNRAANFLRIIAVANLLYCLLSIFFLYQDAATLTVLGWVYFIGEIIIVALIALWEWRSAAKMNPQTTKP